MFFLIFVGLHWINQKYYGNKRNIHCSIIICNFNFNLSLSRSSKNGKKVVIPKPGLSHPGSIFGVPGFWHKSVLMWETLAGLYFHSACVLQNCIAIYNSCTSDSSLVHSPHAFGRDTSQTIRTRLMICCPLGSCLAPGRCAWGVDPSNLTDGCRWKARCTHGHSNTEICVDMFSMLG